MMLRNLSVSRGSLTTRIRLVCSTAAFAVVFVQGAMAQPIPGWDPRWSSPAKALNGCNPQLVREFYQLSARLSKNPNDEEALVNRGVTAHRLTKTSRSGDMYLDWLAAKDLEKAVKLDPKDFAAWHNYGDLNYSQGDDWMHNDHSNARRAVWAFDHAIALDSKSARTYMGRGWAYYQMNDQAHANADFQKALQLDPSLRADMQKEIKNIDERHGQEAAARGVVPRLASYYVEKTARNLEECSQIKCIWKDGECRCSAAFNPGPR